MRPSLILRFASTCVAIAWLTASPSFAQVYAWDGALNGNWATAGNWFGGAAATSNVNTQLFFGATANANVTNNTGLAQFFLNRLEFSATAPAYTLNGGPLSFSTAGTGVAPQVRVDSGSAVTLHNNLVLNTTLSLTGTGLGNLFLNGVVSGAGGLTINRSGNTYLANGSNSFTGLTNIVSGNLILTNGAAIPAGGNVTVASDGVFNPGTDSNFSSDAVGTVTLNSGTMRVTSGSANYHVKTLVLSNGEVNTLGAGAFGLRFFGAGAGITAAGLSTMDGSTTSRIANETGGPLPITVNSGLFGGFLTIGMQVSTAGLNDNYVKLGTGMLILTNTANAGNFQVEAGSLAVSNVAALGSGSLTLRNGDVGTSLAYTGSASASTAKPVAIGDGGAKFAVTTDGRILTLTGALTETSAGQPIYVTGSFNSSAPAGVALTNAANSLGGTFRVTGDGILSLPTIANAGVAQPAGAAVPSGARKFILGNDTSTGTLRLTGTAANYTTNYGIQTLGNLFFPGGANGTIEIVNPTTTLALSRGIIGSSSPNGGILFKTGPGALALTGSGAEVTPVDINVNDGRLVVGANGKVLTSNVDVFGPGVFELNGFSNASDPDFDYPSAFLNNGGTLRVSSGAAEYRLRLFSMTGGTIETSGSGASRVTLFGAPSGTSSNVVNVNASDTTSVMTGSAASAFRVNGSAASIDVEQGTTPNGIDLDVSIRLESDPLSGLGIAKTGYGTMRLSNPGSTANVRVTQGRLRIDDGTTGGVGGFGTGTITIDGGTLQYGGGTATVSKPLGIGNAGGTVEVLNSFAALSLSVANFQGQGGLTKTGPGTLTLTGGNALALVGGVDVQRGLLQVASNTALGASNNTIAVSPLGELRFTAPATTSRFFQLTTGTLSTAAGTTLTFDSANVSGGYLVGSFATTTLGSTALSGSSLPTSSTLTLNGNGVLTNVLNGGQITAVNGNSVTLLRLTNGTSGRLTIAGSATVTDFVSNGTLTVPGGATTAAAGQVIVSASSGPMYMGGGSVTTVGSLAQPLGRINLNTKSLEVQGGLLVNNGIPTSFSPINAGILNGTTRVNYGGFAKGNGYYDSVETVNGGQYSPGNSPGLGLVGTLNMNGGGTYLFEINDATGTAGPTGAVTRGWDKTNVLTALNFTATPSNKFVINVKSLLPPSGDNSGPADHFDPSQSYSWTAFELVGAASLQGAFDPGAVTIGTSQFLNPTNGGSFGLAITGQTILLTFTPVPEPSACFALTVAGAGLWRFGRLRRRVRST